MNSLILNPSSFEIERVKEDEYPSWDKFFLDLMIKPIIEQLELIEPFSGFLLYYRDIINDSRLALNSAKFLSYSDIVDHIWIKNETEDRVNNNFLKFGSDFKTIEFKLLKALDSTLDLGLFTARWKKEAGLWIREFGNRNEFSDILLEYSPFQYNKNSFIVGMLTEDYKNQMNTVLSKITSNTEKKSYSLDDFKVNIHNKIEIQYIKEMLDYFISLKLEDNGEVAFISIVRKADFLWQIIEKSTDLRSIQKYNEIIDKMTRMKISENRLKMKKFKKLIIFDELIKDGHALERIFKENTEVLKSKAIEKFVVTFAILSRKPTNKRIQILQKDFNFKLKKIEEIKTSDNFYQTANQLYKYMLLKNNILDRDHYLLSMNFKTLHVPFLLSTLIDYFKDLKKNNLIDGFYLSGLYYYHLNIHKITLLLSDNYFDEITKACQALKFIKNVKIKKIRFIIKTKNEKHDNKDHLIIKEIKLVPVIIPNISCVESWNDIEKNNEIKEIYYRSSFHEKFGALKENMDFSEFWREYIFYYINKHTANVFRKNLPKFISDFIEEYQEINPRHL